MREIKFRAWDKEKKMWTNWKCYDNMFYFMDKNTGVWIRDDEFKRFVLLQYTGMRDKNGTKIYVGDILELINEDGDTIRFVCEFGGVIRDIEGGYKVDIQCFYFNHNGYYTNPILINYQGKHDLQIMEIIGNIHENPELLINY